MCNCFCCNSRESRTALARILCQVEAQTKQAANAAYKAQKAAQRAEELSCAARKAAEAAESAACTAEKAAACAEEALEKAREFMAEYSNYGCRCAVNNTYDVCRNAGYTQTNNCNHFGLTDSTCCD